MPSTFGWLFDVYPSGDGMAVWLIDEQVQSHALRDTFAPSFYVHGPARSCAPSARCCAPAMRR